jgi:hypothetical protein
MLLASLLLDLPPQLFEFGFYLRISSSKALCFLSSAFTASCASNDCASSGAASILLIIITSSFAEVQDRIARFSRLLVRSPEMVTHTQRHQAEL